MKLGKIIILKMFSRQKRRCVDVDGGDPPSQHELDRKSKIERAKEVLMTLNMSDLKQELKLYGTVGEYSYGIQFHIEKRDPMDICKATSELGIRFPSPVWDFRPLPTKIDIVDWLANNKWLGEGSPFDLLPDEVVLKIVKMATWDDWGCEYGGKSLGEHVPDWILVISRVSVRFNRIAQDKSLWEDTGTDFSHYTNLEM